MDLEKIKKTLRKFTEERDWEQFHNPKNLATALSVEASELLEIFQWSNDGGLNEINDPKKREEIESINRKPILIKISPDLNEDQLRDIALIALANNIDGLILTNTTTNRPDYLLSKNKVPFLN